MYMRNVLLFHSGACKMLLIGAPLNARWVACPARKAFHVRWLTECPVISGCYLINRMSSAGAQLKKRSPYLKKLSASFTMQGKQHCHEVVRHVHTLC